MTTTIEIDDFYPYSYQPQRRYGDDKPPHRRIEAILAAQAPRYASRLSEFVGFAPDFLNVGRDADASQPQAPHWRNIFFSGLDAIALYGMVAAQKPKVFCEVGSGNSTKFAALAKARHSPQTQIVSIDPAPRTEISQICDVLIPQPLQDCNLAAFEELQAGDILFLDGSHRVLQNSDVSLFFLEVLPLVKPGVFIHIHDIFWPWDYPVQWSKRMYSEQYLFGALLLFAPEKLEIVLPNFYISLRQDLSSILGELWAAPNFEGVQRHGGSFWFSKK
jgi:hypothetical protein